MGILTTAADTVYTFRFIKILVTPWEDMPAFKEGIIDKDGNPIMKLRDMTSAKREVYTMFHRLVFKIKRLLNKAPGGKSRIASYGAALWLIKEETGLSDNELRLILGDYIDFDGSDLNESFVVGTEGNLLPGIYKLSNEISCPVTGETLGETGDKVISHGDEEIAGSIFEYNVFSVQHAKTKREIYVTSQDLKR